VHVLLSIGVLMALACTATPATPAPTPDVPLLDKKTVEHLVVGHLLDNSIRGRYCTDLPTHYEATYVGKGIWVVVGKDEADSGVGEFCTFTVHDKEAHVILPQEGKTSD
jgi:hypothetical protein